MALPTVRDITIGYLMAERILQRKIFERLRDRKESKYFSQIIIKDISWNESFGKLPSNIPPKFLLKYPNDFKTEFTTLGCNMLKCYKHDYTVPCEQQQQQPFIINNSIYACGEACSGIYNEIFQFLREEFFSNDDNDNDNDSDNDNDNDNEKKKKVKVNPPLNEFPFETFSVGSRYCGIQLTELKRFALHPSSRFLHEEPSPLNIRQRSGLVDAPPLSWRVDKQNVSFNKEYCQRFVKEYDSVDDHCYDRYHRVALGYIFGDKFIKMFPDSDYYYGGKRPPAQYLIDMVTASSKGEDWLRVNDGYTETPVSQDTLEGSVFTDQPDIPSDTDVFIEGGTSNNNELKQNKVIKTSLKLNSVMIDTIKSLALDVGIEAASVQTPAVAARMLSYYSPKLTSTLVSRATFLPASSRMTCLLIKTVLMDFGLKAAINALKCVSSMASGFLAVGLITMVPDILMSYYNVGGYNNEITREHLDIRRAALLDSFLKQSVAEFGSLLTYLRTSDGYVTPLITPEFVFNLGIVSFLESNPHLKTDIGYNGVDPEAQFDIVTNDYLSLLTTNSVGQKISYENENNNEPERRFFSIAETMEKRKNNEDIVKEKEENNNNKKKNNDYLLASLLFLIFALFSWLIFKTTSLIAFRATMVGSIVSLTMFFYGQ